MKKYIVFIGLQFFAYHAFAQTQQCDNNTTRTTTHGEVCGVLDNKVASYKGISYAKPPTAKNKLRFMPPQSADAWQGVFKATQFSPMCVQSSKLDLPMSEDCLYLNIWTPQNAKETSNKPVLFFIHGGAFVTGSGDDAIYNGEHLSRLGDAVVVTINYRLGALGFAYNKKHNIDGNMGLLDQQLALQWVNDNITAFGCSCSPYRLH
jgi:para-nitrobenzyl esterase